MREEVQSKVIIDVRIWAKTIKYKMVKIKKNNFINAKNILILKLLFFPPFIHIPIYLFSVA